MNQRQAGMNRARRQIMEAAGAQFAVYGYEGTSFSRVAEAMGKPKSAIGYHLFPSKERLAAAVVDDQDERWLRIAAALDDRVDGLETLITFMLTAAHTVQVCPVAAGAVRLMQDMPKLGLEVDRRFDIWDYARRQLQAELAVQGLLALVDLDGMVDVILSATFGVLSYRSPLAAADDAIDRLRAVWIPLFAHLGLTDVAEIVRAAEPLDDAVIEPDMESELDEDVAARERA